jgi:plasmid stability protein
MPADPLEVLSISVPASLAADIRALAKDHDRSISAEVRQAIRAHLETQTTPA